LQFVLYSQYKRDEAGTGKMLQAIACQKQKNIFTSVPSNLPFSSACPTENLPRWMQTHVEH
jgi:hypothetical protein